MKKFIFFCWIILVVAGYMYLNNQPMKTAQASPRAISNNTMAAVSTWTATLTPTANAAMMAEVTLLFQHATDTQVAIAKSEQAMIHIQETQAQEQYLRSVDMTNQAQQAAYQATAIATQTYGMQTMQATQTYGALTAQATFTSGAATQWANVTTTVLAATQTIEKDQLNARRFGVWSMAIILSIIGLLIVTFIASKVWGSWKMEQAKYMQASLLAPDQNGRLPVTNTSALGNGNKIVNPNLSTRAVTDPEHDDLSTEQALANTQSLRQLEATRAIAQSPALTKRMFAMVKQPPAEGDASMPDANMDISKPGINYLTDGSAITPAWTLIESWDGNGGIPYGVSAQGLERVSIQQVPHGGIFGQTGKGKSRYFLRPFIAGAIAAGQRVVILGKQADFWPFASHPNVRMIAVRHFTQEDEATRYAGCLRRIVEEMNRRDDYLTSKHVSTWDRAGRENTLIVLDELGNELDMMPREVAQDAYRLVQGLVKEGRKAGFSVWLASQRAVGFKSIVEQLGRAVFYLADADASRHALGFPGAEMLNDGHFFAKFHGVRKCAAFDPTDDELVSFLKGRAVKLYEPINWIDREVVGESSVSNSQQSTVGDIDQQIMELYTRMKADGKVSLSEIQRRVYGDSNTGGVHFTHIQDVVAKHLEQSGTTTKAATTGNMPAPGLLSSSATTATP